MAVTSTKKRNRFGRRTADLYQASIVSLRSPGHGLEVSDTGQCVLEAAIRDPC